MNRRSYLTVIGGGLVALSGCTSDSGDGGSGSSGNSDESTSTPSVSDYVEVLSHDFKPPDVGGGILLEVTVQNVSDQEIGLLSVDGALYVENERIADSGFSEADITSGTELTGDMGFTDVRQHLEDITRYTISLSFRADGERREATYEYDDFEYP